MGGKNRFRGDRGNRPQKKQPEVAGSGQQQPSREDREKLKQQKQEKHARYIAKKVELAGADNTAVVKTDTPETSRAAGLLNKNDYYVDKLREGLVTNKKINPFTAVYLLEMNSRIRDLLNTQNALLCQTLGYSSGYEPPWGCEAPPESHEAVIEEMMTLIANHKTLVPAVEKVQPPEKEIMKPLAVADRKGHKESIAKTRELPAGEGEQLAATAP